MENKMNHCPQRYEGVINDGKNSILVESGTGSWLKRNHEGMDLDMETCIQVI
jgi:hypothetical protein